jgi:hypothetical protein
MPGVQPIGDITLLGHVTKGDDLDPDADTGTFAMDLEDSLPAGLIVVFTEHNKLDTCCFELFCMLGRPGFRATMVCRGDEAGIPEAIAVLLTFGNADHEDIAKIWEVVEERPLALQIPDPVPSTVRVRLLDLRPAGLEGLLDPSVFVFVFIAEDLILKFPRQLT